MLEAFIPTVLTKKNYEIQQILFKFNTSPMTVLSAYVINSSTYTILLGGTQTVRFLIIFFNNLMQHFRK